MQIDLFSSFRDNADLNGVLFYYSGSLSQNVVATMSEVLKQRLGSQDIKGPTNRKLFSNFIEMVQNALQYSPEAPDTNGEKLGAVAVGRHEDKFFIVCGNLVQKQYVERIRSKLESVKNMSLDEIKQAYRAQLKNESHASDNVSKGAGLGFLTVARDATEPLQYWLQDVTGYEDDLSYFYIKAIV